jgi:beta-lactamase regulating signal transducer with metallopeptidase domain
MEALHDIARMSVQWMVYSLTEGIVLALFAWVLLRLLPRQNAGTRFALWFSVLLAMAALPSLAGRFLRSPGTGGIAASHSLVTLPDSLALAIWAAWLVISALGLLRVVAGLWQVHRIRRNSVEIDPQSIGPEIQATLAGFRRETTLRVSDSVQVPAAIGFLHPAVMVPRWFLEEISSAELQQVVLHELTHLRRRDDWTNLLQKIIKALLFFHPFIWWVEQRLSLEREMACDEAVLAQSSSPQRYAQCLARLAEKSFIRKKIALAQAAVSRMRQLSLRLAQILDVNRPSSTRIWKPAIPMVLAGAALCGFSAWSAPALVSFQDDAAAPAISPAQVAHDLSSKEPSVAQPKLILASVALDHPTTTPRPATVQHQPVLKAARADSRFLGTRGMTKSPDSKLLAARGVTNDQNSGLLDRRSYFEMITAQQHQPATPNSDYVMHAEQVVITMAGGPGTGRPQMWQLSMWQVSVLVPSGDQSGKTVSRKKI